MTAQTDLPLPPQPQPQQQPKQQDHSKLLQVSEVVDGVYLFGAASLPACLRVPGLTCLVSAAPELPAIPLPLGVEDRLQVDVADSTSADISVHLHTAADFIHDVLERGGRVGVHCVAGVSRSPSLVLAYLVKYKDLNLKQAYETVREARPCIRPNTSFFSQLINFEEQVTGKASVNMVWNQAAKGVIPDVYEADYRNTLSYQLRSCGQK